jgi:4-hydroxy-tetrahydrodipicolinate synthase
MSVDTMARLFELKNIVGVKDATGDLDRVNQQKDIWELILFS